MSWLSWEETHSPGIWPSAMADSAEGTVSCGFWPSGWVLVLFASHREWPQKKRGHGTYQTSTALLYQSEHKFAGEGQTQPQHESLPGDLVHA